MVEILPFKGVILTSILDAIASDLDKVEFEDIRSFIAAGEYGLAADTIFSAIDEKSLTLEDTVVAQLASVEHLYNTFGDLDPNVAAHVLRPDRGSIRFGM
jgi:hypothetical protein